jgi:predicted ribosome quality control (RQC) complex YloA/Tae2 family protein
MTKQIFSTTDVAAEAACLRARVMGARVTNVYDAGASKVKKGER